MNAVIDYGNLPIDAIRKLFRDRSPEVSQFPLDCGRVVFAFGTIRCYCFAAAVADIPFYSPQIAELNSFSFSRRAATLK